MTIVKKYKPDVRLAKLATEPGGMRVNDAVRRAGENLNSIRSSSLAALDAEIEDLERWIAGRNGAGVGAAYKAAKEVFGLAGTYGLTELSLAAHSLCEMLAHGKVSASSVPWARVKVHVDAMKKLRQPAMDGDVGARKAIIDGLRQVSTRG